MRTPQPAAARRGSDIIMMPVICLDDSDVESATSSMTLGREPRSSPATSHSPQTQFQQDDFMTDEDFETYISRSSKPAAAPRPVTPRVVRSLEVVSYQGRTYKPGKCVELQDGTFIRINRILQATEGETTIAGPRFERLENMSSTMPNRVNELCWVVNKLNSDDQLRQGGEDGEEVEVPLSLVRRLRIIRMTNHPYIPPLGPEQSRDEGLLYCRLKYTIIRDTSKAKVSRVEEECITYLSPEECQPSFAVSSAFLRDNWRGKPPARGGRYTFGDGFCGAGGVTRGASQAGLEPTWAFDHWPSAMNSYRANFPASLAETSDVADFLTNDMQDIIVDVMHASPPCQPFSPAKTIAAAHDDANEACLFSIRRLIEMCRPRVATMEETSGLKERHEIWLHAIIHSFIELGYSVRWKLLNCKDFGVPQSRRRLVIIASGPGELLPPFPQPTHGPDLLPPVTILDAISGIPCTAPDHDLERAERPFHRPPYDPRRLAKTLTCSGGDNFHPSGTRTFTLREAACLQTFPLRHIFHGPGVMKQIGNAVPPALAKALYGEIISSLRRTDAQPVVID